MITYEQVREQVKQLVDERPDHVDPRAQAGVECTYATDGSSPRCIVGEWAHRFHNATDVTLGKNEGHAPAELLDVLDVLADPIVERFLSKLQRCQDAGTPWAEAFEKATDCIEQTVSQ